ncbi:MAG: DDE-type integrase/transposase/recombinase [Candidatus Kapabacteria bacterium]|jgi:putative transposase|nr:DDE-type integrase/transposase/recombinase [Candidatus Kapabacteria bacterium]
MHKGFVYLTAIIDWYSRYVLSWRLSNSMDGSFCREALLEALERYGTPEIFNTDQGAQFTSPLFTSILSKRNIRISLDGRGRALDNVFIERLWRSAKYECLYLHSFDTVAKVRAALAAYFDLHNHRKSHQALNYKTSSTVFKAYMAFCYRKPRQNLVLTGFRCIENVFNRAFRPSYFPAGRNLLQ